MFVISHPFEALSDERTAKAFRGSMLLLVVVAGILVATGTPLRTPSAPAGILSFELCAYGDRCDVMLESYAAAPGPLAVGFALGIDYLFLFLYPTAIALAAKLAARGKRDAVQRAAAAIAWAALAAGLLDALENAGLLVMAWQGHAEPLYAWTAALAASVKFALLGLGLLGLLGLLASPRISR